MSASLFDLSWPPARPELRAWYSYDKGVAYYRCSACGKQDELRGADILAGKTFGESHRCEAINIGLRVFESIKPEGVYGDE